MNAFSHLAPRLSRLSGAAAALSIMACYGTLAVVSLLTLAGFSIDIHEGAWAAVIVVFAGLAFVGVLMNFRRHRTLGPVIVAAIGAALITWVMFVSFNRIIEVAGFVALITAAVWERRMKTCVTDAEGREPAA